MAIHLLTRQSLWRILYLLRQVITWQAPRKSSVLVGLLGRAPCVALMLALFALVELCVCNTTTSSMYGRVRIWHIFTQDIFNV